MSTNMEHDSKKIYWMAKPWFVAEFRNPNFQKVSWNRLRLEIWKWKNNPQNGPKIE